MQNDYLGYNSYGAYTNNDVLASSYNPGIQGNQLYDVNPNQTNEASCTSSLEVKLKAKYPKIKMYALIQAGVVALIGVVGIILQAILIAEDAKLSVAAGGIWAGVFCLTVAGLSIMTSLTLNVYTFLIGYILNGIGIMLVPVGYIILNAFGIDGSSSSESTYYPQRNESKEDPAIFPIRIVMIVLGVVAFALFLTYFIVISAILEERGGRRVHHTSYRGRR